MQMDYKGLFWFPFLLALSAVILPSLLLFRRLLTKRGIPNEHTAVTAANTSSSSSASASAAAGGKFEVFLSFCGQDTRHGFTDVLYTFLEEVGIRTFRDNEVLRVGEEIGPELLKAIEDSKISIPIFSRNYASSQWCLRELVQMVECKRNTEHKIVPIFYDVKPSDVRHQRGSYEKAFRLHKKHFNEKTVEGWKEALREVGQLKGLELEKETNGHQGKLAKIVVGRVLLELKKNCMDVTDKLVGIEHHLEVLSGLLNVGSNGVWIVGIHGMGGIGKTTIAKVIYNQLCKHFESCCFLVDVRATSQSSNGLVTLQNQLISKILRRKSPNIATVDEGINTIKETFCGKKVLIVLDDVDSKSQFDKLAGKCDWFGPGSRIIITTRNKKVLNDLDVDKGYEVPYMKLGHSLQLFSRHAFSNSFPPEEYHILSREITFTAAGLPLALEVIGSYLYGRPKAIWENTLVKLKKIPNKEVQEKLRISYEALDDEHKQIFLDIACHFIGWNLEDPFYMWEDCEFYPTNGVNELVLRSLVRIEDNKNVLRMHDQLRDLGREIVRQKSSNMPEERSRLWLHADSLDILERQAGTNKVQTLTINYREQFQSIGWRHPIALRASDQELCFTNEEFRNLPNLRFLQMNDVDLTDGDFKQLFSNLRWLRWQYCPGNFSPTNFHLKKLVILDLSYSEITDGWEVWSQIKEAKMLKVLNLSWCSRLTKTPDFSTFATLERLIIEDCDNLVQIGPSFCKLINLRVLYMSRCWRITNLPDAIGNLEKLEEIDASQCSNLQGDIPSSIGRLSYLKMLRLDDTKICSLPMTISGLSSLQTLDLKGCRQLQSLPELPPNLTSLHITCTLIEIRTLGNSELLTSSGILECQSLERILDLSNLTKLKQLVILECEKLIEVQGLDKLESLRELSMSGCVSIERLPDLSNLGMLKMLDLSRCEKLVEGDGLRVLTSLERLDMSRCISIERLPDLPNSGMLKELMLYGCEKLVEVGGLGVLKSLERLDMSLCISLERLPHLPNWGMLKELILCKCEKLVEVEGIGVLKSLERLDMSRCISLERLPDLPNLGVLKELILRECEKLVEVEGLGVLKSLERLDMSRCISLERLINLSNLGMLKELMLFKCEKLVEFEGLGVLTSLEILDMSHCISLERLPDLPNSGMLKKLTLCGCEKLVEVGSLGVLKSLERLDMSHCISLERLPNLSNLGMLKELMLFECEKLVEAEGLGVLKSLERLDMSRCISLERLPDLPNSGMLKALILRECEKLVEVEGLGVLTSLEKLDLSRCISLERLIDLSSLGML